MTAHLSQARWQRRARPLLGTLVEIGIDVGTPDAQAAFDAAWATIAHVQRCLSRFDPESDIARFNALHAGASIAVRAPTQIVLRAARELCDASGGLFDITLGSGDADWHCDASLLHKQSAGVQIDLGGIGKGHAVDAAVDALLACGCSNGWVNAGGDLRAFGAAEIPIALRDEHGGGVRAFATLAEGAFATSHYGGATRSLGYAPSRLTAIQAHASVAAPECLWADALTKIVAASGDTHHPQLADHGAQGWLHSHA